MGSGGSGSWRLGGRGSQGALCDSYGVLSDSSKIVQAPRLPPRDPRSGPTNSLCLVHGKLQMQTSTFRKTEFQPGEGRAMVVWQVDGWVAGTSVHLDGATCSSSDPEEVPSSSVQWALVED